MGVKCVRVIMTRAREEDGQYEHLVLTHMTYRQVLHQAKVREIAITPSSIPIRDAPDSGLYYPAGYRISRIIK